MRLYYIAVPQLRERYDYIQQHVRSLKGIEAHPIVGVDGATLSEEEIHRLCTPEYASKTIRPTIGCSLSHREAWRRIAESEDKCAIITEYDVVLPK